MVTRNGTIRRLQIVPDRRAIDSGDLRLFCVLKFLYPLFSTPQLLTCVHLIFRVENQVPVTSISQPGLHTHSLPSLSSPPVSFSDGGFRSKLTLTVHLSLPSASICKLSTIPSIILSLLDSRRLTVALNKTIWGQPPSTSIAPQRRPPDLFELYHYADGVAEALIRARSA